MTTFIEHGARGRGRLIRSTSAKVFAGDRFVQRLRRNPAGNEQPLNRRATLVIFVATAKVASKRVMMSVAR